MSRTTLLITSLVLALLGGFGGFYLLLSADPAKESPWVVKEVRVGGGGVSVLSFTKDGDPPARQDCVLYGLRFPPEELRGLLEQSNEALAALVQGKEAKLQVQNPARSQTKGETTLRFGFDACDVSVDGALVNEELIRLGWARAEKDFYALMDAEAEAREKNLGIWGEEAKAQVGTWFVRREGFEKIGIKPPFKVSVEWAREYPDKQRRLLQYFALDVDDFVKVVDEAGNEVEGWREEK